MAELFVETDDCVSLSEEVEEKLAKERQLTGEEAFAYLADCFANETHGNYDGETLYNRARFGEDFEIILLLKEKK